jgi:hypothetical protein
MSSSKSTLLGAAFAAAMVAAPAARAPAAPYHHVLLISVDGLHAADLTNFINAHPKSALATLAGHGVIYPNAFTAAPSDSFPGMLALATGGTPKSAGVFYDDSFDRTYFAPTDTSCAAAPGAEVTYAENIDVDQNDVNGGGTLGQPLTQINPAALPRALVNGVCTAMLPHTFVRVNTIFEVIKAAGLRTAWADKHPAYEILNGPSGAGIDDLFTPEINSLIPGQTVDNTHSYVATQQNDHLKVHALHNEFQGLDSTGATHVGKPAIMGMNFQAVSVGQKLPTGLAGVDPSDLTRGTVGGYTDSLGTPNTALAVQLQFVDTAIGGLVRGLQRQRLFQSTLVIITAKHGQSPIDPRVIRRIDDTPYTATPGYGFHIADDEALIWLAPATRAANLKNAFKFLTSASTSTSLGIAQLLARNSLADLYQNPATDSRTPDFVAISDVGVIYTTGTKLAEHGGFSDNDRNVALLVSGPGFKPSIDETFVQTRQVAPTILKALGLPVTALQSQAIEGNAPLPGLRF